MLPVPTTPTPTACPEATGDELSSRPPITLCPRTEYHGEPSGDLGLHQGDAQESAEHGGSEDDAVFSLDDDAVLRLRQGIVNFLRVDAQEMTEGLTRAFLNSNQLKELVERATAGDCPSQVDVSHAVRETLGNAAPSIEQWSFRRYQNFLKEVAVKVSELFGP